MNKQQKAVSHTKKYLFGIAVLLFLAAACLAFGLKKDGDFDTAKQEILLRKIGHEVLLFAGDSTSRVLPIKKTGDHEYQIRFENEFTFQSDSLVKIVKTVLAEDKSANDYIVNVLNCSGMDVVFGYAILASEKNDIVPCSGRKQPTACYIIELKFKGLGMTTKQKDYLLGGIPLVVLIGLLFSKKINKAKLKQPEKLETQLIFGNTVFDTGKRVIYLTGVATELTTKEYKLLLIFAKLPNEIIERSRLQKEIWEDEGVIVGRSLDMFISKLRKKLEADTSVQLKNIHGKGYKLEVLGELS